jgi:hypothetical protein
MAFLVEDGTGLAGATSYTTLIFADSYHADRGNGAWSGAASVKQRALIKATDYLERRYEWRGLRATETQALKWPRVAVLDMELTPVASDSVPAEIQKAVAELALLALTEDLEPVGGGTTAVTSRSKRAGPFSITEAPSNTITVFHKAANLVLRLRAGDSLLRS